MKNLPSYVSHKVVEAAKILMMAPHDAEGSCRLIVGSAADDDVIDVDAAYVKKHQPQIGGYYVRYADGYESWSPADAFEEGYTLLSSVGEMAAENDPAFQFQSFTSEQERFISEAFATAIASFKQAPDTTFRHGNEQLRFECLRLIAGLSDPASMVNDANLLFTFVRSGAGVPK